MCHDLTPWTSGNEGSAKRARSVRSSTSAGRSRPPLPSAAQAGEAWANVVALVEAAGGSARDVVKLTVFVCGASTRPRPVGALGGVARLATARRQASVGEPGPAVTVVQVVALARPTMQIEIKAVAHLRLGRSGPASAARPAAHDSAPRVRRIYRYPVKSMLEREHRGGSRR